MSERMKWSEAEAIVRAYRAEHGATDVDVATLALALGTDEAEVRRLAGRKRRFADASGVLSAAITLAVAVAALLAVGPSLLVRHRAMASLQTPTPEAAPAVLRIMADENGRVHALDADAHTELWSDPGEVRILRLPDGKTL